MITIHTNYEKKNENVLSRVKFEKTIIMYQIEQCNILLKNTNCYEKWVTASPLLRFKSYFQHLILQYGMVLLVDDQ